MRNAKVSILHSTAGTPSTGTAVPVWLPGTDLGRPVPAPDRCTPRDLPRNPSGDPHRVARELAYTPSSCVTDHCGYLRQYSRLSAEARGLLPWRELRYGPDPAEVLHYFPAPQLGSPLHVFVHGGYWQELSETESSFAAPDLVARGCSFVALGYGLAPRHRVTDIVGMVRRALLWLHLHAAELGFDPGRVFLSGTSAGAHLAAMCLLDGWLPAPMRPTDVVRGAALLSGIYDLEPLRHTSIGEAVRLDAGEAAGQSPIRHLGGDLPPLVVARGSDETAAFAEQQDDLVRTLRGRGASVVDLVVPGRNHFDLPLGLADPDELLGSAVLAQMQLSAATECR